LTKTMDYSKAALFRFFEIMDRQGLANANTIGGLKAAATKILQDLSEQEEPDVRRVDVASAVKRYHNKNPGVLAPASLTEYQRRVARVISEFVSYTEDPAGFRPKGRGPGKKPESGSRPAGKKPAATDAGERAQRRPRCPVRSGGPAACRPYTDVSDPGRFPSPGRHSQRHVVRGGEVPSIGG
jgi:hypothetical protein